jgi:hypothetical protein
MTKSNGTAKILSGKEDFLLGDNESNNIATPGATRVR